MKKRFKLHVQPTLNSPVMLASWPGIGNVSTIATTYLKKKLDFKELGEIEASYFFDPIGVIVKDNIVEAPNFPKGKFYYWKNRDESSDIILFIGDAQPTAKGYELANCVIDVGQKFQVKRIYTVAAVLTRIHHSEQPNVWGVATSPHLSEELEQYCSVQHGNLHISGLNGLILGVAKERNLSGVCLLGAVSTQATRIQNPMAALAVLRVLTNILGIKIDMSELAHLAQETRDRMKEIAAEAMGQYINHFTEPIWEFGEEQEEEE